jgi:PEP-CTERM motif
VAGTRFATPGKARLLEAAAIRETIMSKPPASGPAGRPVFEALRLRRAWLRSASALLLLAAASPAAAVETLFATFTAVGATRNVRFVNSGTGAPETAGSGTSASLYSTATGSSNSFGFANTRFSFLQGPLAAVVSTMPAWFQLNAALVGTPATAVGGDLTQSGISGYFRFTSQNGFTVGTTTHAAGTELLRGDFTLAQLTGQNGASTAVFADTLAGNIAYRSDIATFDFANQGSFQMNIAAIASVLGLAGSGTAGDPYRALRSFRGTAEGNFSVDNVGAVSAVPEPETWAMLIAGFVMIGFQQRRRARTTIVAS